MSVILGVADVKPIVCKADGVHGTVEYNFQVSDIKKIMSTICHLDNYFMGVIKRQIRILTAMLSSSLAT